MPVILSVFRCLNNFLHFYKYQTSNINLMPSVILQINSDKINAWLQSMAYIGQRFNQFIIQYPAMEATELKYEPLSLHEKAYLFFPNKKEEKTEEGKKGSRFFYYGQVQFDEYERKKLQQFYEYVNKNKIQYDRQYFDEQRVLLFLQSHGYKPKDALESFNQHLQFRKTYLPVDFSKVQKLIKSGFFYPCGRDLNFRPVLVFDATLFDVKDQEMALLATIYVHEVIIQNTFLPGQIENWTVIYNLGGMGVTEIPISAIKGTTAKMSQNYGGRLFKFFVVNAPGTIYFTWKMVSAFLDPVTVDKIKIAKTNTDKAMFDNIHPSQVEQKFGGKQPNRTEYWPFRIPEAVYDQKRLISLQEYEVKFKKGELKRNTIHPKFAETKEGQAAQLKIQ